MISPLNYSIPKTTVILNQAADNGIFITFKSKTVPTIQNIKIYFIYDNILYTGIYGTIFQNGAYQPYIKNISNYLELEAKIINTPGIEIELFDTFENPLIGTINNIFETYLELKTDESAIFDFVENVDSDILLKSVNLEIGQSYKEIMRFKVDFDNLNPTIKYKFQLKDNYGNVLSAVFNIINQYDVTLVVERYDFKNDRVIKLDFMFEDYAGEKYVVLSGKLPEYTGELTFEAYVAVLIFDSLTYPLNLDLSVSGPMTVNKTSQYELTNPIKGMKTLYKKEVVATQNDASNSNIFIDSVILPESCTAVFKNGKLLFTNEYDLNSPTSGYLSGIQLAENDTIVCVYSYVLKRQDFVIDLNMNDSQSITIDGIIDSIMWITKNGKTLFPTEYTVNGNNIMLEVEENNTISVFFL